MNEKSAKRRSVRGLAKSVASDIGTRANASLAGLLALAGVTGLAGGFDEADPEGVVLTAAPEATVLQAAPLEVEVWRSYVVDDARAVEMRLTNTADRPIHAQQWHLAFQLEYSGQDETQSRMQVTDHRTTGGDQLQEVPLSESLTLNPGVPMDVVVLFRAEPGAQPAAEADTLVLRSMEYRTSFLDGNTTWLTGNTAAEVRLR